MNTEDIKLYIMMNEPIFEYNGIQYSICCPDEQFCTWDEKGNECTFDNIDDLLNNWEIDNKLFKDIVEDIFN